MEERKNKIRPLFVVLALAAVAVIGYMAMTPAPEPDPEITAIERCRAQQNDELQDLATRRTTREQCDRLEAAYREKWGRSP